MSPSGRVRDPLLQRRIAFGDGSRSSSWCDSTASTALSRKNSLFAGSDGGAKRWAVVGSLVETCKLHGVELYAWLCDVLGRMVDGHPQQRLDELLPWKQV